jgi:hypothetical protein
MVSGLEEELKARMSGTQFNGANRKSPSRPIKPPSDVVVDQEEELPVMKQGADLGLIWRNVRRVVTWVRR